MVRTEDACEIIKYALQNEIKVYLDGWLEALVSDYKIHLVVPREIEDFSRFKTSLGAVFEVIKASEDKEANGNSMNEQIEKLKRKAFTISLKNYIIDQIKEANTEQKEMKHNERVLSYSSRKKNNKNLNSVFQRIDAEIKSNNTTLNNNRNNYLIKKNKIDNSKYMSFANNIDKSNNKLSLSLPSFSKPKIKCKTKVVNTCDSVDNNRKNKMKKYNDRIYQINMSTIKLKAKSKVLKCLFALSERAFK